MGDINEIFERVNLQNIRCLFVDGVEEDYGRGKYQERLKEAERPVKDMLEKMVLPDKQDDVMDIIFSYAARTQDVYMEIGLQCGARLAMQLLGR